MTASSKSWRRGVHHRDGRRVLACSSSGGHFKQLVSLVDRLPDVGVVTWLTYDSGLTLDLLRSVGREHDRVVYAPYAAPRDLVNLTRDARVARRLLREDSYDLAVSTGAGIAVAVLPLARAAGIRACFIESATRTVAPSLSGRILSRCPGIELYTQNPGYPPDWSLVGSVHDEFDRGPDRPVGDLRRVVVTLGTIRPYGFRRLVERLVALLPEDAEVTWQTGATQVSDLGIDAHESIPAPALDAAIRQADVVIAHAGTGSALTAFELGHAPILVPRRHRFGEHVDDHQVVTARMLAGRGLAVYAEVEELSTACLLEASRRTVVRRAQPPAMAL